ncbi:MAG: SufE family protein [Paludibacteraceae bacterium]|nr:SufE family protein [Paludibacteraceae bacterium]
MNTINEIQDEIIEEFTMMDEWIDRYELLIDYGKSLKGFPEEQRTKQNLIEGCQSQVWFTAALMDGKVIYQADSDAVLVKGIVSLLLRVLNNQAPKDIVNADLYFIKEIGLQEHLSPTRSNGLAAMLHQMKLFALALSAKS